MGMDVMTLIRQWIGDDKVKAMENSKRIVKELWSS